MPGLTSNGLPPQCDVPEPMGYVGRDGDSIRELEEIEEIERYATPIDQKYKDLQLAHSNLQLAHNELQLAHNELQLAHNSLGGELRRLQELDFNARKKDQAEPHGTISQRFLDVFRMSTDWARDYFRIHIDLFCLDGHELFKKHLSAVSWEGTDWTRKRELNVSHLVQAVVAEVLARRILLSPFAGCPNSFRHEFGQLYEVMLKENQSKAQKWRATTLAMYGRCREWVPLDPSVPPKNISQCRERFYLEIAEEIDLITESIARTHFPDRSDHDQRLRRSMVFIEAAGDLAINLGKQAAGLKIMDKSWFEGSRRVFVCDDERMKGRFAEEDEDPEGDFRADIILRPGFLKYGNDDGENLERYAVWIPAMLDLSIEGDFGVQPPPHLQNTLIIGSSRDDVSMGNGSDYPQGLQTLPGAIEDSQSTPTSEEQASSQREPPTNLTQPKVRDSFRKKQDFSSFLSNTIAKMKRISGWKGSSLFSGRREGGRGIRRKVGRLG